MIDLISPEARASAGGIAAYTKGKQIAVASTATQTLLDYSAGPGYIADMWMYLSNAGVGFENQWNIKVTVDSSVMYDGDQSMFFCQPFWGVAAPVGGVFGNDYVSLYGGNQWNIPIPFSASVKVEVTNLNPSTAFNIWWTIGYITGITPAFIGTTMQNWGNCNVLHVEQKGANYPTDTSLQLTQDQVGTIINQSGLGPGRLFGLYLNLNGFNCNNQTYLEGTVDISLDGVLALRTSGIEDYMGMSGYFAAASVGNGTRFKTLTGKRVSPSFYSFMRFHVPDPMLFNDSLEIQVKAGDSAFATFTGALSVSYTVIYYTKS